MVTKQPWETLMVLCTCSIWRQTAWVQVWRIMGWRFARSASHLVLKTWWVQVRTCTFSWQTVRRSSASTPWSATQSKSQRSRATPKTKMSSCLRLLMARSWLGRCKTRRNQRTRCSWVHLCGPLPITKLGQVTTWLQWASPPSSL